MRKDQPDPFMLSLMAQEKPGFPLQSTMVMVQIPEKRSYDAEALLKAGSKAEGLRMFMTMEAQDIKLGVLDAALFNPPKGYSKQ